MLLSTTISWIVHVVRSIPFEMLRGGTDYYLAMSTITYPQADLQTLPGKLKKQWPIFLMGGNDDPNFGDPPTNY